MHQKPTPELRGTVSSLTLSFAVASLCLPSSLRRGQGVRREGRQPVRGRLGPAHVHGGCAWPAHHRRCMPWLGFRAPLCHGVRPVLSPCPGPVACLQGSNSPGPRPCPSSCSARGPGLAVSGLVPFCAPCVGGGGEAWLHLPHLLLDEAPAHLYCPDESQAEDVALYGGGTAKPADCLLVAAITPAGAPKPFAVLGVEAPADPGLSEKQVCQPGISNNCFNDDVLCCFCCFHRSYFFATLLFFCSWSLVPRF